MKLAIRLPLVMLGLIASGSPAPAADGQLIGVAVDQARIVQLDHPAATVIVGNPAIVDVKVLSTDRLVLTGRNYGITNMVVLDANGDPILDEQVAVRTFEDSTVRVYRQGSRITYACAPKCEPTVTIGDNPDSFSLANQQYMTRQSMALEAAKN